MGLDYTGSLIITRSVNDPTGLFLLVLECITILLLSIIEVNVLLGKNQLKTKLMCMSVLILAIASIALDISNRYAPTFASPASSWIGVFVVLMASILAVFMELEIVKAFVALSDGRFTFTAVSRLQILFFVVFAACISAFVYNVKDLGQHMSAFQLGFAMLGINIWLLIASIFDISMSTYIFILVLRNAKFLNYAQDVRINGGVQGNIDAANGDIEKGDVKKIKINTRTSSLTSKSSEEFFTLDTTSVKVGSGMYSPNSDTPSLSTSISRETMVQSGTLRSDQKAISYGIIALLFANGACVLVGVLCLFIGYWSRLVAGGPNRDATVLSTTFSQLALVFGGWHLGLICLAFRQVQRFCITVVSSTKTDLQSPISSEDLKR